MKEEWIYVLKIFAAFVIVAVVAVVYSRDNSPETVSSEATITSAYEAYNLNRKVENAMVYVVQLSTGRDTYITLRDSFAYKQCKEHTGETVELMYDRQEYKGVIYTSNWRVLFPWDEENTTYEVAAPKLRLYEEQ